MQYTKGMRVMRTPSSTQKKFYLENDVGNSLEDAEVISPEDKDHEEDGSRTILNNKVMVTKLILSSKVIKLIPSSKVTRGTHKDGINNEETFEVNQTLEEDTTDLGTRWTLVIMH